MSLPYSPISPSESSFMDPGRRLPPISTQLPELLTSERPDTPPKTPGESQPLQHKRRRSQSVGAEDYSFKQPRKVPRIDLAAPQIPPYHRESSDARWANYTTQPPPKLESFHSSEVLPHVYARGSEPGPYRPREDDYSEGRPPSPRAGGLPLNYRPVMEMPRLPLPFEGDPSRTLPPLEGSRRLQGSSSDERGVFRPWETEPREPRLSTFRFGSSSSAPTPTAPLSREEADYAMNPFHRVRTAYRLASPKPDARRESASRPRESGRSPVEAGLPRSYSRHESDSSVQDEPPRAGRAADKPPTESRGRSLPPTTRYEQYTWESPGAPMDQMHRRRRGNLPKEATAVLNEWFTRHYGYPYPKEEEKQQLQAQTGLSMSQISNWFINARRRRRPGILSRRPETSMPGQAP